MSFGLVKVDFPYLDFDAMQKRFGFGKGASCTGCGCGMILLILFILFACSIIFNTNWTQIGF
jgi:hypothetical protein